MNKFIFDIKENVFYKFLIVWGIIIFFEENM